MGFSKAMAPATQPWVRSVIGVGFVPSRRWVRSVNGVGFVPARGWVRSMWTRFHNLFWAKVFHRSSERRGGFVPSRAWVRSVIGVGFVPARALGSFRHRRWVRSDGHCSKRDRFTESLRVSMKDRGIAVGATREFLRSCRLRRVACSRDSVGVALFSGLLEWFTIALHQGFLRQGRACPADPTATAGQALPYICHPNANRSGLWLRGGRGRYSAPGSWNPARRISFTGGGVLTPVTRRRQRFHISGRRSIPPDLPGDPRGRRNPRTGRPDRSIRSG
jgi:hypothetical protein